MRGKILQRGRILSFILSVQRRGVGGGAQLERPHPSLPPSPSPVDSAARLSPLRVHLTGETHLVTTRSSSEQTFPPFPLSSSPSPSAVRQESVSESLLLSGINRCSPQEDKISY